MNKLHLVEDKINAVEYKHRLTKKTKKALLNTYFNRREDIQKLSLEVIEKHDFEAEVKRYVHNLEKVEIINKNVVKLERHAYAPEMNCLHFKSGLQLKVSQETELNSAIVHCAKMYTLETIQNTVRQ